MSAAQEGWGFLEALAFWFAFSTTVILFLFWVRGGRR